MEKISLRKTLNRLIGCASMVWGWYGVGDGYISTIRGGLNVFVTLANLALVGAVGFLLYKINFGQERPGISKDRVQGLFLYAGGVITGIALFRIILLIVQPESGKYFMPQMVVDAIGFVLALGMWGILWRKAR